MYVCVCMYLSENELHDEKCLARRLEGAACSLFCKHAYLPVLYGLTEREREREEAESAERTTPAVDTLVASKSTPKGKTRQVDRGGGR